MTIVYTLEMLVLGGVPSGKTAKRRLVPMPQRECSAGDSVACWDEGRRIQRNGMSGKRNKK